MKKILFKYSSLIFIVLLLSINCKNQSPKANTSNKYEDRVNWKSVQNFYSESLNKSLIYLDSLSNEKLNGEKTKYYFAQLRSHFKNAEPYASYLNPQVGHRTNGPALPIYKDDSGKVVEPVGLQKLEETIFEEGATENDFLRETYILKGLLKSLKNTIEEFELTPKRFFIATHQQLMRLVSLSMSGFDTPVSGLSISETKESLAGLFKVYELSISSLLKSKNLKLHNDFKNHINKSIEFIGNEPDFISFDRYTFIRDYLNPVIKNWVQIRKESNIWDEDYFSPLNLDAYSFFDNNSFNANFFIDKNNQNASREKISLGKKLFFDKNVSKSGTISCASCHLPEKAYTDGLVVAKDNKGNDLLRNTPTLINSIFQKSFFWDGRSETIQSQINNVFNNEKEFNSEIHELSEKIFKDSTYTESFKKVFGKMPRNNKDIVNAIAIFVASLKGFNSKFDKNIRGEKNNLTASEKNGFNIFMGKGLCATCHFMPLTNGTVPPFFTESEKEVIGVPGTSKNIKLDDDLGFYSIYGEELHRGMFKTPTIRNIALTAPYMHNGIYDTLEKVVDFYNKGGGGGLGFDLPHQTLPFDNLNLTVQEQKDLVAFMESLTDEDFVK